jgi:2-C-methyl-D-erythritol 2,4-cyclodiphosphate synthase
VCDALLGAAGLGDIGLHFPDTDPMFKDISSITILSKTVEMLNAKAFRVINLDSTIMAEAPKLSPYKAEMQKNISRIIEIEPERVNVKATTSETLGLIGRGEGIAAFCVALIE